MRIRPLKINYIDQHADTAVFGTVKTRCTRHVPAPTLRAPVHVMYPPHRVRTKPHAIKCDMNPLHATLKGGLNRCCHLETRPTHFEISPWEPSYLPTSDISPSSDAKCSGVCFRICSASPSLTATPTPSLSFASFPTCSFRESDANPPLARIPCLESNFAREVSFPPEPLLLEFSLRSLEFSLSSRLKFVQGNC